MKKESTTLATFDEEPTQDDQVNFQHIKRARQEPAFEQHLFLLFFTGADGSKKVYNWLWKKVSFIGQHNIEDLYQDICMEFLQIVRKKYQHNSCNIQFKTFCYTKFGYMILDYLRRLSVRRRVISQEVITVRGSDPENSGNRGHHTIDEFYCDFVLDIGSFNDTVQPHIKVEATMDVERFIDQLDDPLHKQMCKEIVRGRYKPEEMHATLNIDRNKFRYELRGMQRPARKFFGIRPQKKF